jgi:hypothetical protein
MNMSALNRRVAIARSCGFVLVSAAMALGTGCGAEVYSEPVRVYPAPVERDAVVYVDIAPQNIETYPRATAASRSPARSSQKRALKP